MKNSNKVITRFLKRYTFSRIQYQDIEKKKLSLSESFLASFDMVYTKDDTYWTDDVSQNKQYYEANLIRIAYEVIRSFCQNQQNFKIRICFSGLLDMLISSIKISEETFIKILTNKKIVEIIQNQKQNEFRQPSQLENILFQQYGINKQTTQQIISYFKISSNDISSFMEFFEDRFSKYSQDLSLISQYFQELLNLLSLYKVPKETIIFDTCILPDNFNYHSGLIFDVINYEELEFIKKRSSNQKNQKETNKDELYQSSATIFIKGGRYDHFFIESQIKNKQQQDITEGIGLQVYIEEIFNIYFKNLIQSENKASLINQLQDYNYMEVAIVSENSDVTEEKFNIAEEMWNHQIKAHVILESVSSITHLIEKLKKSNVKFLVTVKKAQKIRYTLKLLNQSTGNSRIAEKEKEYEINEIIDIIKRKIVL